MHLLNIRPKKYLIFLKFNVQHRTPNVEHRMMMSLRSAILKLFVKYFRFFIFSRSTFDVGRSMFDVHLLVPPGQKRLSAHGVYTLAAWSPREFAPL